VSTKSLLQRKQVLKKICIQYLTQGCKSRSR